MNKVLTIVNIKEGLPTVEVARQRLLKEIDKARQQRVPVMKIIHGYGSTGAGGALRKALRDSLKRRRSEGKLTRVIFGERWSIFEDAAAELIRSYPSLRRDRDLEKYNEGMTIIELRLI